MWLGEERYYRNKLDTLFWHNSRFSEIFGSKSWDKEEKLELLVVVAKEE